MDHRETIADALARACAHERELWGRIRGKAPGEAGCPDELWREWLRCATLVRVLSAERASPLVPGRARD
jgi:hypothetical protein